VEWGGGIRSLPFPLPVVYHALCITPCVSHVVYHAVCITRCVSMRCAPCVVYFVYPSVIPPATPGCVSRVVYHAVCITPCVSRVVYHAVCITPCVSQVVYHTLCIYAVCSLCCVFCVSLCNSPCDSQDKDSSPPAFVYHSAVGICANS